MRNWKKLTVLSHFYVLSVAQDPSKFAVAVPTTLAATQSTAVKDEPKKEVKKEESESEDEDMGFGLFD